MKKILLTIIGLSLASPAWSAQTAITEISGIQPSVGALKTQINSKLGTVESNRQDHETRVAAMETGKAAKPHINASAPADTSLDWYDTDQEVGVYVHKKHNGTTWVRVGSHGVQYLSNCASIAAGMCVDTDDGKLYYHNGTAVVEVGTGGSGTTYTAGTGIDITDGVISSTVTGSVPSGTADQDTLVWNAATSTWEPITTVEITAGTNITITNGVVDVKSNTYQPLDADLSTAAGASTAGNSKYFGTNSSGSAGFYDLPTGGGSFAFDTFPTYEDSAHSSGIAVNGTTLAIYSSTAGKWLTAALSDTLNAAPATYTLTLDGTGWNGTDAVTVGISTLTVDGTFTGLSSATTAVTCTPDTGRSCNCSGTGITGTSPDYVVDMSANRSMACTFADIVSGVTDDFTGTGALSSNWTTFTSGDLSAQTATRTSDKFTSSVYNTYAAAIWTGKSFAGDQWASMVYPSTTVGDGVQAVLVRFSADGNGYYGSCYTGTACFIRKVTSGTETTLGSSFTGLSPVEGKTIKLTASGSTTTTLELFIDGVSLGTRTDSTSPYTSGAPGIRAYGYSPTKTPDDFAAGDL